MAGRHPVITTAMSDLSPSRTAALGEYLRTRRARLDPAAFGLPMARRRTPGLRREEVASRANVSPTWYTWLEQGRGGAPSADVLDRIARALMLTEDEREHLYLIALGRPPGARYEPAPRVGAHLQRVLDALPYSPAYLRTAVWEIVAWNRAAAAVLTDYADVPAHERNLLRMFFLGAPLRRAQPDFPSIARVMVAAFRADVARAGAMAAAQPLVDELQRLSPEFAEIWRENDVRGSHGEAAKKFRHPRAGLLHLDYSSFSVEGRPDLDLIVFTASTPEDDASIRALMATDIPGASALAGDGRIEA